MSCGHKPSATTVSARVFSRKLGDFAIEFTFNRNGGGDMQSRSKYPIGLLILLIVGLASAQTKSMPWEKWQFLIGQWEAAGQGNPGAGKGVFSFAFDLQNKVIVRKSHTDYPASAGRPAFAHDDLMVIHKDETTQKFRADYYDNEGHVIAYTGEFSADGKALVFFSDPLPAQPRFRLTYLTARDGSLTIKFDIAPPNDPGNFKTYVEGTARKK